MTLEARDGMVYDRPVETAGWRARNFKAANTYVFQGVKVWELPLLEWQGHPDFLLSISSNSMADELADWSLS